MPLFSGDAGPRSRAVIVSGNSASCPIRVRRPADKSTDWSTLKPPTGTMLAWSLLAVGATNASKTLLQIPALQKGCDGSFDDWTPEAVLALITLIVDLLERVKMLIDHTPQAGGPRIAWPVQRQWFDTRHSHEKHRVEESHEGQAQDTRPVRRWPVRPAIPFP